MKVVITGGPHSGKTTLIDYLANHGYHTIPEAAKIVLRNLGKLHGREWVTTLRINKPELFQDKIIEKQEELEQQIPANTLVFLDRSMIDTLAYACVQGNSIPSTLIEFIQTHAYDRVFLLDTVLPYNTRGRMTNEAFSKRIRDELEKVYNEYGHNPIRIPQMPVEERAQRIINMLNIKKNQ